MNYQQSASPSEAHNRLEELLSYVEQVTRLDERPVYTLNGHRLGGGQPFIIHQQDLIDLSGAVFDQEDEDGPIWMTLKRLRRGEPPQIPSDLIDWLVASSDPDVIPTINDHITKTISKTEMEDLISEGNVRIEDCHEAMSKEAIGKYDVIFRLEDKSSIEKTAQNYITTEWNTWAELERPIRKSIRFYQKLFEIIQKKEVSIDVPFEIVWGIGVTRWKKDGKEIDLPLIERLAEIEIDENEGGEIRIRPRLQQAYVNLRPYDDLKIEGAALAQNSVRRLLENADEEGGISPFRIETYEPILRVCQSHLDVDARYTLDDASLKSDVELPPADDTLLISNRWVIFARRRSENFLLRDLSDLKQSIKSKDELPSPAKTLVVGAEVNTETQWQSLGNSLGEAIANNEPPQEINPLGDLFFPKPFNNEQVEIVRRLEKSDGVVVQGPPGTGKTHTISNIICHYLAIGKRVLVVSHGEPALAVLRSQLPEQVRDLAISVTSSEREGLKQVETAARLMQSIIQDLIPSQQISVISNLERSIIEMRKKLVTIDEKISEIANKQLSLIPKMDITPADLANKVVNARSKLDWFIDRPSIYSNETDISNGDIDAVREARNTLGNRLEFIDDILPSIEEIPNTSVIAEWHDGIIRAETIADRLAEQSDFSIRILSSADLEIAEAIAKSIQNLLELRTNLNQINWLKTIADNLVTPSANIRIIGLLKGFVEDASKLTDEHYQYLERPVELPDFIITDTKANAILERLSQGQKVFGLLDFSNRSIKPEFDKIRISNKPPNSTDDWLFVKSHIRWISELQAINLKWRGLSVELNAVELDLTAPKTLNKLVNILRTVTHHAPDTLKNLEHDFQKIIVSSVSLTNIWLNIDELNKLNRIIRDKIAVFRFNTVKSNIEYTRSLFDREKGGKLASLALELIENDLGNSNVPASEIIKSWDKIRATISDLQANYMHFEIIRLVTNKLKSYGAISWANSLSHEVPGHSNIEICPNDWNDAWDWAVSNAYLNSIDRRDELKSLSTERVALDQSIARSFETLVRERAFYSLGSHMTSAVKSSLMMFAAALRKIGSGTGKAAGRHRRAAREAMSNCYGAIPCWIMPSWRVAEQLPGEVGSFDLVIMDEASQADIREITTLLRGKKILVVGDDRQVSPTAAFIENSKIEQLERGYLKNQPFRTLLLPGASLYDLAKVMFPDKFIMLREHFRCVEPIIRFSMQFYKPEPLIPLRVPMPAERLSPPLVDIFVSDGFRTGDKINEREADVIVDEIKYIISDPKIGYIEASDRWRTIGVISLIGNKQANLIYKKLVSEIGEELISRHRISCGDSATFQGNEKDIVFLSMIADPKNKQAQTALHFEQRFNVALSRARDRMVLVHSVTLDDLKPHDLKAKVLQHFANPMGIETINTKKISSEVSSENNEFINNLMSKCDSDFEREILGRLITLGYDVTPQVGSLGYSIDLVVDGENNRLAIECDGDNYHGPEKWAADMSRQRILERVGWRFWRCWASSFKLDPEGCMIDLIKTMDAMGIHPRGAGGYDYQYTEFKTAIKHDEDHVMRPVQLTDTNKSSGISVGDRVVLRDIQNNKSITYTLTTSRTDELNGLLGVDTHLGKSLIGLEEEDEIDLVDDNGKITRILIVCWERSATVSQ